MAATNSEENNDSQSPAGTDQTQSRYVVGIDLGTTNCAVAFVDTDDPALTTRDFPIPQWVDSGQFESRETLPSFLYQWTSAEAAADHRLPWQVEQSEHCTGAFARDSIGRQPGRVSASAKSWLSHDGVDRTADLLPWHGDADVTRLSPVDVSSHYLRHIREAWDHANPHHPLDQQDVVITLPASFDEVARELTVRAAKKAGLPRIYLIEEPQAAFYGWIDRRGQDWQTVVRRGQLILVCDIGGGTTDLTLIRVRPAGAEESGDAKVQFHRVAVGKHLILGGDNLDLAIAKLVESKLETPLPPDQWQRLVAAARGVKELMLSESRPDATTLHLSGSGSSLIGGGQQVELTAAEIDAAVIDGFFPAVELDEAPESAQSGFQEFGLPYAADAAVTRHLADFLRTHRSTASVDDDGSIGSDRPDLVLFNGGVMASPRLRERVVSSIAAWFSSNDAGEPDNDQHWSPKQLDCPRLDLAVARGAAYYGLVRRGQGVRIAANLGHSYYLQVSEAPPRAMCVIPASSEPGQSFRCDDHPLHLSIGQPVQFPLWVSSTRLADPVGGMIEVDRAELSPLPPICTVLTIGRKRQTEAAEVVIESQMTEIGTVGLFCLSKASDRRWRLEFDIRSTLETDRDAHLGVGEAAGIVDEAIIAQCREAITDVFGKQDAQAQSNAKPSGLIKRLQSIIGCRRDDWPPSLLRQLWQALMDVQDGRRQSANHEARWLGLVGYCLRPGFGVAADDWRSATTWRTVHGKLAFAAASSRTESMILWRRIAGGLTAGQQQQLASPLIANLRGPKSGGGKSKLAAHEVAEAWRLVSSLERLSSAEKTSLAESASTMLSDPRSTKILEVLIWSIGRLATRVPVYGPLNLVVPPVVASAAADSVMQCHGRGTPSDIDNSVALTLVQVARQTGDRFRDLSVSERADIADHLTDHHAAEHLTDVLLHGGHLPSEQQSSILGDSLPLGIRIAS